MTFRFVPSLAAVACVLAANCADGLEHVTLEHDGAEIQVSGRVEVEARDGGLLLLAADGVLWVVQPEQQRQRSSTDAEFQLLDRDGLNKSLLNELPAGFRVHDTAHYLICYNTSPAYAKWCGALYERLYDGFRNFWTRRGLTLHDPAAPLVAVLFDSKAAYIEYARHELGEAAGSIPGYYSLRTNRITTYDLTGVEQFAPSADAWPPWPASTRCSPSPTPGPPWPPSSTRPRTSWHSIAACIAAMPTSRCGSARESPCISRRPI